MLDGTRVCVGRPQKGRMVVNKEKVARVGNETMLLLRNATKLTEAL